jgi:hypothetical protein
MKVPVTLHVAPDADHSLTVRGAKGAAAFDGVLDAIPRQAISAERSK